VGSVESYPQGGSYLRGAVAGNGVNFGKSLFLNPLASAGYSKTLRRDCDRLGGITGGEDNEWWDSKASLAAVRESLRKTDGTKT